MSGISVISPGLYSNFQDAGRPGYRDIGVPISGAMDQRSFRLSNRILNNTLGTPALEITLMGPKLQFEERALIAITGADMNPVLDGIAINMNQAVEIEKGQILHFGKTISGCRSYLAVQGGFQLEKSLGSYSCYEPAQLGPRVLRKGDKFSFMSHEIKTSSKLDISHISNFEDENILLDRGPEFEVLSEAARQHLLEASFTVSNNSNRMGVRLDSEDVLDHSKHSMLSSGVIPGTVQLPPNGFPIVLMRDAQTTGGYPRIAQLTADSIDLLAQKKPGDCIKFAIRKD